MTPFRNEKNSNWEGAFRVPWPCVGPAISPPVLSRTRSSATTIGCPRSWRAAGMPEIMEQAEARVDQAGDKTFKVHLDGSASCPPHRARPEGTPPRLHLLFRRRRPGRPALRQLENRLHGATRPGHAAHLGRALLPLRLPKLSDLRTDPVRARGHHLEHLLRLAPSTASTWS